MKGRVVYDRKKHTASLGDVRRFWFGFARNTPASRYPADIDSLGRVFSLFQAVYAYWLELTLRHPHSAVIAEWQEWWRDITGKGEENGSE